MSASEVVCVDECIKDETSRSSICKRLSCCLRVFINTKDMKFFVVAYGVFMVGLGIAMAVGMAAIRDTTTTTVHTKSPIPIPVVAAMVILTGVLFSSLAFRKPRYLIITTIMLSSISAIVSAIGAVHYGTTVTNRLTSLSDCLYVVTGRLCTCVVHDSSSRISYSFENTRSCTAITTHLLEVVYGMCGVFAVSFAVCCGGIIYGVRQLHKNVVDKIKYERHHSETTKDALVEEEEDIQKRAPEIITPGGKKKCPEPWQCDVATQTSERSSGAGSSCRHKCRHVVEVTVPNSTNDYVVNITKNRDPPPAYCETVYT